MSKPSFFLFLLLVAFLAATASLRSGGAWWGDIIADIRYEARADIDSLKDDLREIRAQVESAPYQFRALWKDASGNFRVLEAELTINTRMAARRIGTLIKAT